MRDWSICGTDSGPLGLTGNRERRFAIPDLNHVVAALGHISRVLSIGAEHEVHGLPARAVRGVVEFRAVHSIDDHQFTASMHGGDRIMPAIGTHDKGIGKSRSRSLLAGPQQRLLNGGR